MFDLTASAYSQQQKYDFTSFLPVHRGPFYQVCGTNVPCFRVGVGPIDCNSNYVLSLKMRTFCTLIFNQNGLYISGQNMSSKVGTFRIPIPGI